MVQSADRKYPYKKTLGSFLCFLMTRFVILFFMIVGPLLWGAFCLVAGIFAIPIYACMATCECLRRKRGCVAVVLSVVIFVLMVLCLCIMYCLAVIAGCIGLCVYYVVLVVFLFLIILRNCRCR